MGYFFAIALGHSLMQDGLIETHDRPNLEVALEQVAGRKWEMSRRHLIDCTGAKWRYSREAMIREAEHPERHHHRGRHKRHNR